MKTYNIAGIIFLSVIICGAQVDNTWKGTQPKGYLLALKVVQIDQPRFGRCYNHASLFKINFDGMVTELWNYTLNSSNDVLFDENLFAVDSENELVYLGSADQFLALELNTGVAKVQIHLMPPNLQYFQTYDYSAKDKAIYGICTGNSQFNWCRVKKSETNSVHLDFLYQLPYTNEYGPTSDIYFIDQEEQTIWYYPSYIYEFAIAVNYTNAEVVFVSAQNPNNTEDLCIVHDRSMKRTFSFVWNNNNFTTVGLGELFPKPKQRKILLDLPKYRGLLPANFGACAYDQTTHAMMILLRKFSDLYHGMPTGLLLIDTVSLTYKLTQLPTFREKWDSSEQVTALKFIESS